MQIAFLGYGSIAKRHIVNLAEVLSKRKIDFSIDVFRHQKQDIQEENVKKYVADVYEETELLNKYYDILFITNPTSLHYSSIIRYVDHAKHMFIEKPVFDTCDVSLSDLALKENGIYYVACPLRYTSVLQYVKQNIDLSRVRAVRAISSSYLPDWRPGIDYRSTYSAHKDMGGGVAIDLIHEWDYLTDFFGHPEKIWYAGGKYSDLELDSDDLAVYIGIYKDKLIELHLDYFGRSTIRSMTLFTDDDTVVADLTNSKIEFLKSGKTIDLTEDRNTFQKRELEHFLDIIEGKCPNDNTVHNALEVLKIAKMEMQ